MLDINIKYFDKKIDELKKMVKGDWIDVRASRVEIRANGGEWVEVQLPFMYPPMTEMRIFLGIGMELPKGYEGHTAPRGSTFKSFGFIQTNSVGVVDESYKGDNDEWFIPVFTLKTGMIAHNDRFAQFRIIDKMPKVRFNKVEKLGEVDRGGFGNSGNK